MKKTYILSILLAAIMANAIVLDGFAMKKKEPTNQPPAKKQKKVKKSSCLGDRGQDILQEIFFFSLGNGDYPIPVAKIFKTYSLVCKNFKNNIPRLYDEWFHAVKAKQIKMLPLNTTRFFLLVRDTSHTSLANKLNALDQLRVNLRELNRLIRLVKRRETDTDNNQNRIDERNQACVDILELEGEVENRDEEINFGTKFAPLDKLKNDFETIRNNRRNNIETENNVYEAMEQKANSIIQRYNDFSNLETLICTHSLFEGLVNHVRDAKNKKAHEAKRNILWKRIQNKLNVETTMFNDNNNAYNRAGDLPNDDRQTRYIKRILWAFSLGCQSNNTEVMNDIRARILMVRINNQNKPNLLNFYSKQLPLILEHCNSITLFESLSRGAIAQQLNANVANTPQSRVFRFYMYYATTICAIQCEDEDKLRSLLQRNLKRFLTEKYAIQLLRAAIKKQNKNLIEIILKEFDATLNNLGPALVEAAGKNNLDMCKYLVKKSQELENKYFATQNIYNAIKNAIAKNNFRLIEFLMKRFDNQIKPLDDLIIFAIKNKNNRLAHYFLKIDADSTLKNISSVGIYKALMYSIKTRDLKIFNLAMQKIRINMLNPDVLGKNAVQNLLISALNRPEIPKMFESLVENFEGKIRGKILEGVLKTIVKQNLTKMLIIIKREVGNLTLITEIQSNVWINLFMNAVANGNQPMANELEPYVPEETLRNFRKYQIKKQI